MPKRIIDSHIHLWPSTAANAAGHAWMEPGAHLTREYNLSDYTSSRAIASLHPQIETALAMEKTPFAGVVYIETDRYYPKSEGEDVTEEMIRTKYAGCIKEMSDLTVMEAANTTSSRILAVVPFAPLDIGPQGLQTYLKLLRAATGSSTWTNVRGFRYLLQGIKDETEFRKLVFSDAWLDSLKVLAENGWSFDLGVDQRSGGVWQLEAAGDMVEEVRKREDAEGRQTQRLKFVCNHLCKPDFEGRLEDDIHKATFARYSTAMLRLCRFPAMYLKLSGGFSELGDQSPAGPWPTSKIFEYMKPWLDVMMDTFGTSRTMFGSDWPVCNVRGPGEKYSWSSWRALVELTGKEYGWTEEEKERVWWGTANEAYGIGL